MIGVGWGGGGGWLVFAWNRVLSVANGCHTIAIVVDVFCPLAPHALLLKRVRCEVRFHTFTCSTRVLHATSIWVRVSAARTRADAIATGRPS